MKSDRPSFGYQCPRGTQYLAICGDTDGANTLHFPKDEVCRFSARLRNLVQYVCAKKKARGSDGSTTVDSVPSWYRQETPIVITDLPKQSHTATQGLCSSPSMLSAYDSSPAIHPQYSVSALSRRERQQHGGFRSQKTGEPALDTDYAKAMQDPEVQEWLRENAKNIAQAGISFEAATPPATPADYVPAEAKALEEAAQQARRRNEMFDDKK